MRLANKSKAAAIDLERILSAVRPPQKKGGAGRLVQPPIIPPSS